MLTHPEVSEQPVTMALALKKSMGDNMTNFNF